MDSQELSKYGHVFRPGLFRRRQAFWLNGDILHWRKGTSRGHIALTGVVDLTLVQKDFGNTCRLIDLNGRRHHISERHWFGWDVDERHRFGTSELRSVTFNSLVSAIKRRSFKKTAAR
ncbi:hypothetical protein [Devosia equisanguinis]|uniref:hypothetical protein n=1 Tax=Devosia equisanguinis TaxID=2490941 RepID=UPI000F7DAC23|nr:hypothetical protein [Devosia equisanguinis]